MSIKRVRRTYHGYPILHDADGSIVVCKTHGTPIVMVPMSRESHYSQLTLGLEKMFGAGVYFTESTCFKCKDLHQPTISVSEKNFGKY